MGYDFIAKEDGQVTMILKQHDGKGIDQQYSFIVKEGVKYSWDQTGVEVEER